MCQKHTRKRDTSKKRNAILDASIICFTEFGFDNTSMDLIARKADASKRTLYNHFENKEALFQAVIRRFLIEFSLNEIADYQPDVPVAEQLAQIIDHYIKTFLHDDNWLAFTRIALGVFISQPEITVNIREICHEIEQRFVHWLTDAREAGKISIDDPQCTSDIFHAAIDGAFLWPSILGQPPSPENAEKYKKHIIADFIKLYVTCD